MLKNNDISLQNKILIAALMLFIAVYFLVEKWRPVPTAAKPSEPVYADTVIPRGHVLVPVEIANIQAVAGLIDRLGVIDLYAGSTSQQNSFLIAARIKILRAPLNPNQYAVLVTEAMSREIMKYRGPFWAVVQNRTNYGKAEGPPQLQRIHVPSTPKKFQPATIEVEYYKGSI